MIFYYLMTKTIISYY